LRNVHNIYNQDMRNNLCIIGVELNAQTIFLSHKFTRRDICATHQLRHRWCFAWNDARRRLARLQFIEVMVTHWT